MNVQFQQFKTHFILPPAILIADKTIHAQPRHDLGLISNILALPRICNNPQTLLFCSFFWNFVFWSLGKIKYLNKMFGVFQIKKNILDVINHNMFGTSVWLFHYARYLLLCVQRSWWPFFSLYVTTGLRHQPPERPRCITTNGHYLSIGPNIKKNTNWGPPMKGALMHY